PCLQWSEEKHVICRRSWRSLENGDAFDRIQRPGEVKLEIDELKDRMVVQNRRKGVEGRIGGQCKETLDRASVFLKVSLKNSGLPVVNYGDRSKPLRPASAPQCDEARRKRVLRPSRM